MHNSRRGTMTRRALPLGRQGIQIGSPPMPTGSLQSTQFAHAADSSRKSATTWTSSSRLPAARRPRRRALGAILHGLGLPSHPLHFQFLRLVNRLVTQLVTRSSATAPKRTGGTHSLPNPQPAAAAVPRAKPYFPIHSMVSASPINSAPMQMGRNPARAPQPARPWSPFRTPAGGFLPSPAEGPGSTSAAASCTMRRSTPSCSARRPLASRRTPSSRPSLPPWTRAAQGP